MAKSRPKVVLCAAMSIDGKIATRQGDSKLSTRGNLVQLHKLRAISGAVIIGKNTVINDDPILTVRSTRGKNPLRVILDSRGTIPIDSRIIQTCKNIPTVLAVSKKITKENLQHLSRHPLDVVVLGNDSVDPTRLLNYLHTRGIRSVLLEGGSQVNWSFIELNLIDELILTITPYIIGGNDAISLVSGNGFARVANSRKFRMVSSKIDASEIILHYMKI